VQLTAPKFSFYKNYGGPSGSILISFIRDEGIRNTGIKMGLQSYDGCGHLPSVSLFVQFDLGIKHTEYAKVTDGTPQCELLYMDDLNFWSDGFMLGYNRCN
jgi:hypothetical protein